LTLVERRLVGGECSYFACMPTKTMLRAPELVAATTHTVGSIEGATLDAQRVFAWRDVVAERDDSSQVEWLASMNAEFVRGEGVVSEPGVVHVGDTELRYDRLVIATGSSPVIPPIDGLDKVDYWTNVDATTTTEVPERLVVLGGGPVGCELAQFFQRVGSQVTIVQNGTRILARVDADAAELVAEALQEDGVELRLGVQAERVARESWHYVTAAKCRSTACSSPRAASPTSTGSSRSG